MAIETERTIIDGIEQIVATGDSGDEAALQRFTEEQNSLGFDIGPGVSVLPGGILQRTYARAAVADDGPAEAEADDADADAGMDITDGALAFANENDIDLSEVVGSGAGGRIIMKDVKAALASAGADDENDEPVGT
ncbi:hypothetical protein LCGC14_1373180 [marine sediment metagenome]|uniref:Peripheral subunit-binding (PSBD) domain-containing protein n=1 Tax=marine sediment metagenome TaxID=412755 RepID=A0A0F9K536_9ZZZZ